MSGFWDMGGYAVYVWGSYGAGVAVLAWNWVAARRAHRHLLGRLRRGRAP